MNSDIKKSMFTEKVLTQLLAVSIVIIFCLIGVLSTQQKRVSLYKQLDENNSQQVENLKAIIAGKDSMLAINKRELDLMSEIQRLSTVALDKCLPLQPPIP